MVKIISGRTTVPTMVMDSIPTMVRKKALNNTSTTDMFYITAYIYEYFGFACGYPDRAKVLLHIQTQTFTISLSSR